MVLASEAKEEEKPIRAEIDALKAEVDDIRFKANWEKSISQPIVLNKKPKKEEV